MWPLQFDIEWKKRKLIWVFCHMSKKIIIYCWLSDMCVCLLVSKEGMFERSTLIREHFRFTSKKKKIKNIWIYTIRHYIKSDCWSRVSGTSFRQDHIHCPVSIQLFWCIKPRKVSLLLQLSWKILPLLVNAIWIKPLL